MPAKSKAQQMATGAALSAKRGDIKRSELKGASRSMVESMSEEELHDLSFCSASNLAAKAFEWRRSPRWQGYRQKI